ncbi:MAG: HAD-IA family hydrolase, partial [Vicingaceae bacterium]
MQVRPEDIPHIDNIILDLGGVLLNIDHRITQQAFIDMGIADFDDLYSQSRQNGIFDRYEKGLISTDDFISFIQELFPDEIPSDSAIVQAWNAMILDFPEDRLKMLEELSNNYKVLLLSNTNELHYREFVKIFEESFNKQISDIVDESYFSHELGMRKPEKDIFEHVLDENNLVPETTLFIDDTKQNIKAAKKLKLKTNYLESNVEIVELVQDLS